MMKRILMMVVAMMGLLVFAEPEVTDVVAKQRYPWNGLVDITCKVTGIEGTAKTFWFTVGVVMPDTGNVLNAPHLCVVQNGTNSTDLAVRVNGTYRLVWNASADLGQVTYDNMVVRVNLDAHRKVQLWAGGPYWAETNIGAENPEDCGYYFWWGDTIGYKRENNKWVATDGSSSNFSFSSGNTPTYSKSFASLKSEEWITADEVGALVPEHDAAHVHWGDSWRMPTVYELINLRSTCTWSWTTMNGVNGYLVSGKGDYSSSSIFLPCAGYGSWTSLNDAGSYGYYWSSVSNWDSDSTAWYLSFSSGGYYANYYHSLGRFYGYSVRAVQGYIER